MTPTLTTPRLLLILSCQVCVYLYISMNTTSKSPAIKHSNDISEEVKSHGRFNEIVDVFKNIPLWIGNYIASGDTDCDFGPSNTFKYMQLFGDKKVCALDLVKYFLINPTHICPEGRSLDYLVIVNSKIDNSARRRAIRKSYGKPDLFGNMTSRIVFLLGADSDRELAESIQTESDKYSDIVQGDFSDTYHNLTLKGILGLRWISNHCPGVKNVIKIDDDVFVNIFRVHDVLFPDMPSGSISCSVNKKGTREISRGGNKRKSNDAGSEALHNYPFDYCDGMFVLISGDLISLLLESAKSVPFFWVDDVYLFGMLPARVGQVTFVPRHDLTQSLRDAQTCFRVHRQHCTFSAFYSDQFDALQVYLLWSALSNTK